MIPGLSIDWGSSTPAYRQIVESIQLAVRNGVLEPPHKLPPTRELARDLGVNRNTVVSAYDFLAREGWIQSQTGRGTFLVPREPTATDPWFTAFSRAAEDAASGDMKSIYRLAIAAEGISFVGSYPAGELMPVEAFGKAVAEALKEEGASILTYGPTAGHTGLRETIASEMRAAGSPTRLDDILITNGAQQALELVFRTFVDRGDPVIVEEPTYTGALNMLGAVGARIVGVPVDERGIRPDLLSLALERHHPRLMYLQPTFHNPTNAVMPEARRREVLALAEHYQCPVVEDDWAADLRLEGEAIPSLHALDGGRHVIHLSTFSKKLMPGLRVGWVTAPTQVLDRLIEMKRISDCGTSPLLQAALNRFLRSGGQQKHLDKILPVYRRRRDAMVRALEKNFPAEAAWIRPTGGLFIWVALPDGFDGNDLFVAARRQGVLYSRGQLFHSDGSGRNHMRLTFSAATPDEIAKGVETLGALLRERWPTAQTVPRQGAVGDIPIF